MSQTAHTGATRVRCTFARVQVPLVTLIALLLLVSNPAQAAEPPGLVGLDALYPSLDALYLDLHRNPELSLHEGRTAAEMAARRRELQVPADGVKKVTGTDVIDFVKFRQLVAKAERLDDAFFEQVLGKPK